MYFASKKRQILIWEKLYFMQVLKFYTFFKDRILYSGSIQYKNNMNIILKCKKVEVAYSFELGISNNILGVCID